MIKKELASRLLAIEGMDKSHNEWKKPAEKMKNSFLIQEAAKIIAKKKIDIQVLSEEK
jgi:hypothetical protein